MEDLFIADNKISILLDRNNLNRYFFKSNMKLQKHFLNQNMLSLCLLIRYGVLKFKI